MLNGKMTNHSTFNIEESGSDRAKKSSSHLTSSDTDVKISHRTDAVVRGLAVVLKHHGARPEITLQLNNQLKRFLNTFEKEDLWLKHIKYILTYPQAKYLRNKPPTPPEQAWEPTGHLRSWMKVRLARFNRKNSHLWYSWLQTKRASLPASDEIVQATYDKHFKTLTSPDPGDDSTIERILTNETFGKLLEEIAEDVAERYGSTAPYYTYTPSRSASFEATRSQLGSFGALRKQAHFTDSDRIAPDEFMGMDYCPKIYNTKTRQFAYATVRELRAPYGSEKWGIFHQSEEFGERLFEDGTIDPRSLLGKAQRDYADNKMGLEGDELSCKIQGILEPMKVRVISKGNALEYYEMKPLQKSLHSAIRRLPPFRLTGQSFDASMMLDLYEKAKSTDEWFSVDYSAATDGLSWKYSGAIFRRVISKLPQDVQEKALKVLGPHKLWYPLTVGDSKYEYKGKMTNGQLMGSPLSFPVLCLANLGVYLDVTSEIQQGWTDKERLNHVLVNGDDMVYAAPPQLWDDHISVAAKVGLEMSVGKAYRHPIYANVNSTSVHLDLRKKRVRNFEALDTSTFERSLTFIKPYVPPEDTPWRIDYLNTGLLFGQRKVQGKTNDGDKEVLVKEPRKCSSEYFSKLLERGNIDMSKDDCLLSSLNLLLDGALPGKQSDILKQFLSIHKDEVRSECTGVTYSKTRNNRPSLFTRNLFLPISVGGMGINKPNGWKGVTTPIQRHVYHSCMDRYPPGMFDVGRPLPFYDGEKITPFHAPWALKERDANIFENRNISMEGEVRIKRLSKNVIPCVETRSCLIL